MKGKMIRGVKYLFMGAFTMFVICAMVSKPVFALDRENSMEVNVDESVYYGEISEYNTSSGYKFVLTESGRLELSATAKIRQVYYGIYDAQGEKVWGSYQDWNSMTEECNTHEQIDLIQGTYYFVVERYGYDGFYSFSLSFTSAEESFFETSTENNNSFAAADDVVIGAGYNGQLAENDGKDFYRFVLSESGRIVLDSVARMEYMNCAVYDASGNEIWEKLLYWNSVTEEISNRKVLDLTQGTYYIVMEKYSKTGCYSFNLSFTSAEESFAETGAGENNSIRTANDISMDMRYNGQIAENDAKDFYKFTLRSSGKVTLDSAAGMEYIQYLICDASGATVWKKSSSWNSITEEIRINEAVELKEGTYYFVVDGYGYTGNYSFEFTKWLTAPVISSATNTSSGVKLKWGKISNASGYYVYRKNGSGEWKRVKTTTSASWTDTNADKNGTQYQYKVCAYDEDGKGTESAVRKIYYLSAPTISGVKNTSAGKATVKWNKNSKASGYQIKYVTGSTTKTITVSGKSTVQKVVSGLTKGKTYQVYVRTYRNVSGVKYYSAWSKAKNVKISK